METGAESRARWRLRRRDLARDARAYRVPRTGAVGDLVGVLRPGGVIVITTPNRVWQGVVRAGYGCAHFTGWRMLSAGADCPPPSAVSGLDVVKHIGFHAWPFQFGLVKLSRRVARRFGASRWARLMLNQAVLVRKAP
jgi:hypothetical protein